MANQSLKIVLFSLILLLLGGCRAGVSTSRSAQTRGVSASKTCCAPGSPSAEQGRTQILRGRVVVAHEVRSFVPEGDTTEYWLRDRSGALEREYDRVSGGARDGRPVEAELRLRYAGRDDEGFAAQYDGVYEVEEIRSMQRIE